MHRPRPTTAPATASAGRRRRSPATAAGPAPSRGAPAPTARTPLRDPDAGQPDADRRQPRPRRRRAPPDRRPSRASSRRRGREPDAATDAADAGRRRRGHRRHEPRADDVRGVRPSSRPSWSACLVAVLAACVLAARHHPAGPQRRRGRATPRSAAARTSAATILSYDYRHLDARLRGGDRADHRLVPDRLPGDDDQGGRPAGHPDQGRRRRPRSPPAASSARPRPGDGAALRRPDDDLQPAGRAQGRPGPGRS